MRVLVACEFTGTVREEFLKHGHDVYSCDLLPSRVHKAEKGRHICGDVEPLLKEPWDLVIAHPPCTYLANSGVRWFKDQGLERVLNLVEGVRFFKCCLNANSPRVCVENPIQHRYAKERIGVGPSQIIQPWQFGHGESKATCLWLKGLPRLTPTDVVSGRRGRVHQEPRGPYQKWLRSLTYQGIAEAMVRQWG